MPAIVGLASTSRPITATNRRASPPLVAYTPLAVASSSSTAPVRCCTLRSASPAGRSIRCRLSRSTSCCTTTNAASVSASPTTTTDAAERGGVCSQHRGPTHPASVSGSTSPPPARVRYQRNAPAPRPNATSIASTHSRNDKLLLDERRATDSSGEPSDAARAVGCVPAFVDSLASSPPAPGCVPVLSLPPALAPGVLPPPSFGDAPPDPRPGPATTGRRGVARLASSRPCRRPAVVCCSSAVSSGCSRR